MFRGQFGDYYVAGIRLGADTSTFVSYSTASSSEDSRLALAGTVKLLFFSKDIRYDEASQSSSEAGTISLEGYDTLSGDRVSTRADDAAGTRRLIGRGREFVTMGKQLQVRVENKLDELGLKDSQLLSMERCTALCRAGLVVELILLPFAGLRDFCESLRRRTVDVADR